MTNRDRLEQLLISRHPCVAVSTFEEEYVLGLLREIAVEREWDLWLWSVTHGLRDGLLSGSPTVTDTENPAAALYYLARECRSKRIHVMVDLAGHLKEERALRLLRETIARMGECG